MAVQETTPPRNILIGYKELTALAVTILVIAGAIMGAMQWAVVTAVTPLREEIRELSRRVDAGFSENRGEMADMRKELADMRGELADMRKDISDLSNRVTRIETILEQRQGTTAPDTP